MKSKLDYIGVSAYGLKMGAITPQTDLPSEIREVIAQCDKDGLVDDGDILCITESIVAKSQNNYITIDQVVTELREKHGIDKGSNVLVLYPITSRNRFSAILKSIARAVKGGKVIVQLTHPDDEVGNRIVDGDLDYKETYSYQELKEMKEKGASINLEHPITGLNYLEYYTEIIGEEGSEARIVLSNNPKTLIDNNLDSIIISSIHRRKKDRDILEDAVEDQKIIDLTEVASEGEKSCRWGLLGSNLSTDEKLKLAPKNPFEFTQKIKEIIQKTTGKTIEVIIYGDGAYKDPESGIYELADPVTSFGYTDGVEGKFREGNKYKYLVDKYIEKGYSHDEVDQMIRNQEVEEEDEGTTPRKTKDLTASLADLISGSADAGTPLVLIKNFL
ncbi:F(420)-0:gamma-glutamyl ligase F420 coenzyme biosynthesis enzyme CofE [Methanonatronarchaeum thermophilum]|uniref:F(420)-0:gamma-glutamyl ligase F420 coenzyme biosynthesis enzyme CofE n=1 Tax=Methanonatronarchaeum thermophilum TaxID=1927129 RepID=A0A1Y3GC94_9EURY|nr:coenzyme F420-0:L-glutamate ligase [Methanonatronarchaeum thermophilum]OUJ19058.1 F(420)-0:gamma-glutamyl ligase F420 coenzyme biosynthesis enzyme CofE [Methanonatronarchaeum thermophilum]